MIKKPSFLERLTGSVTLHETEDDGFDDADDLYHEQAPRNIKASRKEEPVWEEPEEEPADGELPVDMYRTGDSIVIRALVAGVDPDDLEISITRDMVILRGRREEVQEAPDEDYYHRELFWGSFSRTILLPEEVQIDEAEARERHGLLEIILPKVDKNRSAKLSVKVGK